MSTSSQSRKTTTATEKRNAVKAHAAPSGPSRTTAKVVWLIGSWRVRTSRGRTRKSLTRRTRPLGVSFISARGAAVRGVGGPLEGIADFLVVPGGAEGAEHADVRDGRGRLRGVGDGRADHA